MSFCPHCSHCTQSQSQSTRQDETNFIEAEVDRLGSLINTLTNNRVALLRRLNTLRSTTRNLPPHVLSRVFEYVVSPVDITSRNLRLYSRETYSDQNDQHLPLLLGSVCSQWYHIVQATPELWVSLVIDVQGRHDVAPSLRLLRLYLTNSKDLSFSLELNFNHENLPINATNRSDDENLKYDPDGFNLLVQFRDVVFQPINALRIKVLRLSSAPPAWSPFDFEDFLRLEELRFGYDTSGTTISKTEITCNAPRLKGLIAKHTMLIISPTIAEQTWAKSISSVNLLDVPIGFCLHLLQLLPNLTDFRARGRRSYGIPSNLPTLDKELVLPKMEVLEWTCVANEWSTSFLRHVRLPSLRTLGLGIRNYNTIGSEIFDTFLAELPSTVTDLELVWFLEDPEETEVDWSVILTQLPSVRKLSLIRCLLANTDEILGCLSYDRTWLPALEEVCIIDQAEMAGHDDVEIPKTDNDYKVTVRKALLKIAETRRERLGNGFQVKTFGRHLNWDLKDRNRVRKLTSQGLRLGVFEDGQLVEHLYEGEQ